MAKILLKEMYFFIGGYFGTSHQVYLNTKKSVPILKYASSEEFDVDIKSDLNGLVDILQIPLDEMWFESIMISNVVTLWIGRAVTKIKMYWTVPIGCLKLHLIMELP
ncbi:hypothetical protein [Paenibacillus turpanensis]|uniref:hypothetical protein n=1 Tax=Paenibacillus turpanensis TaxID=2689078 RepID=UPI00140741BB|nr:hypothetical protein [Paenibacillus turpanensis]